MTSRIRFNSLNSSNKIIYQIIGLNTAVFLGWNYALASKSQFNDYKPLKVMHDNFTLSSKLFSKQNPNYFTLLTNAFSHKDIFHFGVNSFMLHSFGPAVVGILGAKRFLYLYLAGGVSSSFAHIIYYEKIYPRLTRSRFVGDQLALGSSGAVSAVVAYLACHSPMLPVNIMFIPISIPLGVVSGAFFSYDLYNAITAKQTGTGHAAHLGGGIVGLLFKKSF